MADAYESKFNSYTDTLSGQLDPKNLFVKNIPADLTEGTFLSLFSEGGKEISSYRLYPAKDNRDVTIGLVSYNNESDALERKTSLNNRPPLYLKIEFAKSKTKNMNAKHSYEQGIPSLNERGHGRQAVPGSLGRGRSVITGTSSQNHLAATGHDPITKNMNAIHSPEQGIPSLNERGHGRQAVPGSLGRGCSVITGTSSQNHLSATGYEPIGLKITLEGDKRIAYQDFESVDALRESSYSPDLPELIRNLCLFCNKQGDLSCGKCRQPYCSVSCQRQDWPKHQSLCKTVSTTVSKQKQFANDSSYMSEGSSSDNERRINNNLSINRPVNRNQSGSSTFECKPTKPIVGEASPNQPRTHVKESPSHESGIQRKFIKANDIQEQVLSPNKRYKVSVCKSYGPSNFWIHLEAAKEDLDKMEKDMTSKVLKNPVKCAVGEVCCTFENGKFVRVRILKSTPSSSTVKYIDYGGTSDVLNNKLYFLPESFKKYLAQAIECNLVDGVNHGNVIWSDEEVSSFEFHIKKEVFTGHVLGSVKNTYNIDLINDEGISLYSIVRVSRMEELGVCAFPQSNNSSLVTTIPSVLSDLKQGAEVTIGAVQFEEDKFWGFLENGSRISALKELQNCLRNVETKDISLTCEEGDTAVGFSPSLSQFCRCIILKRLHFSFLVRYIDYASTEKITKLQILSPVLLQKKSYVICCEKPTSLSIEDMKLAFETTHLATVKTINNMFIELSFSYKNRLIDIRCYPWYHGTAIAPVTKSHSSVPKNNKCSQNTEKKISVPSKQSPSRSEILHKSVITKDLMHDKKLDANLKYNVIIVLMKDVSEIYVQLIDDNVAIKKLTEDINKYCNSEPCSEYFPIVDEIVCCKFTDNYWYRAQVTEINKDKFKVIFIDYGNDAEVSVRNIKPLLPEFATPKFSICVSLYEIKNEDLIKNQELLLEEIWCMELKDLKQTPTKVMFYLKGKSLTALVGKQKNHSKALLQFQELPNGISKVVLSYGQADKIYVHQHKDLEYLLSLQTQINSLDKADVSKPETGMVYSCLSRDGCWYRGLVKEIFSKSIKVNYIDYGNDEDILINNLKELPDDLFSHPVYCVPVIVQNQKLSELKPEKVFSVELVTKKDGMQLVKVLNLPRISDLKSLFLKEGVNEVKLSFCENDIFYCHLKNHFSEFENLGQKLNNPQLKPLHQTPTKGDLVCARSSDGCWYRASVQSVSEKGLKYKVFFIDYGNCEDVSTENIQCLPKDLLSFPMFCVPVKILNIGKAENGLDINSVLSVKTVGFSNDKVQLVELVLPNKAILPKLNSLKKQLLPTNKEIDVSPCHIQDDILFVQMVSSKELLTTLEAKLRKASEFNDLTDLPEIGDIICAKFNDDGIWYRGSVEKVLKDLKSCEICFIDYGNSEVISLENMKILPSSLCTFPVLSVPVKFKSMDKLLEEIRAGISVFSVRVIDSSDTIFLVDIAVPEDDIQLSTIESEKLPLSPVEVMIAYKEADVVYVQRISNAEKLQAMTTDLQKPIFLKKLLRHPKVGELCNVKYEDGLYYRAIIKEQCCENKFKAFFVDYGNLEEVELINIYHIPSKYSSVPGLCSAVKFDKLDNLNVLNSNPVCTIKYTGNSSDNVQIVKLCPAVCKIPISSLKQNNLDIGVLDVTFLSFDGEFHFLHKLSDSAEINEMNSILEKFEGDEILGIPTVDEVLVVKSKNHSRCRGCIKAVNETSKTCKVFLVDYGTTEEVPLCNISYMSEKLSAFPIFCIKVTIKDSTFMAESFLTGKQYSATVVGKTVDSIPIIQIFKRYMLTSLKQQRLPLNELSNVVFYHQDGDIFFLQEVNDASMIAEAQAEVRKHASSDPLSPNPIVGELLCAKSQSDGSWYRCCVEEIISSEKCKIRFIDYGNDEVVMREDLRSFNGELAMYPSFAIPVRVIDNEGIKSTVQFEQVYSVMAENLENNVQLVKLMLQHDSRSHIPSENVCTINNSKNFETKGISLNPSDSDNSAAKETCIPSTSTAVKYFYSTSDYIHFPDGEQDIIIYSVNEGCSLFCAPFNSDAIAANVGLCSEITQYCENVGSSSFNGDSLPELDELVLAKYDADNQWYRAVIVDDSFHPFYDVIFADYGNTQRAHIDYIRRMENDFMSLPVQAHLCSITGFTIDEKSLSNVIQELKSFEVFVNPAPLKAFVTSNGEDKCVNIPEITEYLVEKKLVTVLES